MASDAPTAKKQGLAKELEVASGMENIKLKISPTDKNVDVDINDDDEEEVEDFMAALPAEVKRRVRALKKLQVEVTKIEANFYAEMHALECKYAPLYQPHFEKRTSITIGVYEPNDEECDFKDDEEEDETIVPKEDNKTSPPTGNNNEVDADKVEKVTGVPNFWLAVFLNSDMLNVLLESHDEAILSSLTDIKVEMISQPRGFNLHFHFSPNDFFTNTILTKSYEIECEVNLKSPFSFEGPEINRCSATPIAWKEGKNVTVKTTTKQQKHKKTGVTRTIQKSLAVKSFFNFFSPPIVPEGTDFADVEEDLREDLINDFAVGQYIRERIVPRAVLYYTGEASEDEDDEEEEDEDDEEEEDDLEDGDDGEEGSEEEEEEVALAKKAHVRNSRINKKKGDKGQKEECKQQ